MVYITHNNMSGLTLEQLQKMGAKPAKPVGLTLEEIQSRGGGVFQPEPKLRLGQRIGTNISEDFERRRGVIKESIQSSDPIVKKFYDQAGQVVGGAWDIVNETVAGLIPQWIKKRFAEGVEKTQEPVRELVAEKFPNAPKGVSVFEKISQKIDEPTQYMAQTSQTLLEQAKQMRAKAETQTNPEIKKLSLETAKGMETAAQEITNSISETEKRLGSLSRSAESTEILGTTALAFATPKTIPTIKQETGKIIDVTWSKADDVWKAVSQETPAQLEQQLTNFYAKAVKPSVAGKLTVSQADKALAQQVVAISLINKNIPKLKFIVEGEEIIGKTPENIQELAEAVGQTKKEIFNKYNELATASNQVGGKVDLNPIADELEKVAGNPVVRDNEPTIARYAQDRANTYRARGAYDILTTQDVIKLYNEKLNAFYRNPTPDYTQKAVVDAMIVNKLREMADKMIENTKGAGYQELKNQYGALKSVEKEIVHRAIVEARKNNKGLLDFTDIASGAQLASFIFTGNVGQLASSLGIKALTEYYKYLNSTNRSLAKMFEVSARLQREASRKVVSQRKPATPSTAKPNGGNIKPIAQTPTISKVKPKSSIETKPTIKSTPESTLLS